MKKILFCLLVVPCGFVFAEDKPITQKPEGCLYADVLYKLGEKHRVQKVERDPVTKESTMRDVEPAIWQQCIKNPEKESGYIWITINE